MKNRFRRDRKMSKLLKLLLCIGIICGASACSSSSDKPKKEELRTKETKTTEKLKLKVAESGYNTGKDNSFLNYGIKIDNPNETYYVEFPTIVITVYADDNSIIANEEQVLSEIAPKESIYYSGIVNIKNMAPSKVEFAMKYTKDNYQKSVSGIESKYFVLSNTNKIINEHGSVSYTGQITNNSKKDARTVCIVVIYRKDGVIAGGNSTYLYSLNSGETTAFELLCASSEEYSYELHALTW